MLERLSVGDELRDCEALAEDEPEILWLAELDQLASCDPEGDVDPLDDELEDAVLLLLCVRVCVPDFDIVWDWDRVFDWLGDRVRVCEGL